MFTLAELGAFGGVLAPVSAIGAVWWQASVNRRDRAGSRARQEEALRAADAALLAKVQSNTEVMATMAAALAKNTDEREQHEAKCEGRWGETTAKIEVLIERGRDVLALSEKLGSALKPSGRMPKKRLTEGRDGLTSCSADRASSPRPSARSASRSPN